MPATDRPHDHLALGAPLAEAVREAGALALRTFRAPLRHWLKNESSPVSEADLAVDALLRERLGALAPDIAWLSEETEDDPARLQARRVFVVDPIDGTRAYIGGLPDWTISAALVVDGRPVLAALYAPATEELFLASVGAGATRNGEPLRATTGDAIGGSRVAGPRRLIDWVGGDAGFVVQPKVHSLALRLTRVAHGTLDAAFASGNSNDWDLAAADLLVHEAGGAVTTLSGQRLTYNRPVPVHQPLVAAGPQRHPVLLEMMQDKATEST